MLYRGDTVPGSLSKTNIISKMDLRVSALLAPLDYSLIEFAKECTSRKYYLDKLKLILVSKLHLNSIVKNPPCKQTDLFIPFMLIMRFDCHLLHLILVKPEQYMLVNVATSPYSANKNQINEDGTEQLVNVLSYIKAACHDYITDCSVSLIICALLQSSALEMKAKFDTARVKKHVGKIDDLLDTSPVIESQNWETKVFWPDESILDDNCKQNNDSKNDEENIHDKQEEEGTDVDSNEEEKDDDLLINV